MMVINVVFVGGSGRLGGTGTGINGDAVWKVDDVQRNVYRL
jgi:hypothetical protein